MQTGKTAPGALSEENLDPQSVSLLERTWRFMLFVVVPVTLLVIWLRPPQGATGWLPLLIAVLALGLRRLVGRGRVRAALYTLILGLWLVVSVQCVLVNGIRSPVLVAYPVILTMAGWLLGRRAALLMLVLSVFWLGALAALDARFWPVQLQREPLHYWVSTVLVCGLASLLAVSVAESRRRKDQQIEETTAALLRRLDELQRTRERLETFFTLNPIPASITRLADGVYLDVNPAWTRLSGWTRGEMLGRSSTELGIWLSRDEREVFAAQLEQTGLASNYPARFRMRDGEVRDFIISAECVDHDGGPAIFSAFVDITALRQTEAALARLNHELEQRVADRTTSLTEALDTLHRAQDELVQSDKLASLGSLVAGVAHELNTPIGNSVLIASSLTEELARMRTEFEGGQLRKSRLASHLDDSQRALGLLEDALLRASDMVTSFKQVAIDQSSERRRRFALHELVRDICDTLRPGMRNQSWRLETVLETGLVLDSYPGPLGQVISNLVQNAFVHGLRDSAGGEVRVTVRRLDSAQVELAVADDGRGIDADTLSRIFDPFFTTRLGQGGSGLGLAIVYRLVTTVLGGRIAVRSAPGEGSCFTVTLPIEAPHHA